MNAILAFLGFGRTARFASMRRKAADRLRRAYGPTFGFYPHEYRTAAVGPEGAGNVRSHDLRGMANAKTRAAFSIPVLPYRAGWGIPV